MKNNLILIGAGGHCKSCINVINSSDEFKIEGILDRSTDKKEILGFPIVGNDSSIQQFTDKKFLFLITVGQIKSADARIQLYELVMNAGGQLATIKASSSIVSSNANVGVGTIIMHHTIVNADACVGSNSIINNKALIEHDCIVGNHCHISTGAIINGGCKIGNNVFIGSGAVVLNGINIADGIIVGAGSVVHRSLSEPGTYAGNPVKKIA